MEGVVSAWPSKKKQFLTTHSPKFMGLNQDAGGIWSKSNYGAGVIVGVLDSGINPDSHPSFMAGDVKHPPPSKWNGTCDKPVKCNNKLIGARSVAGGSPTDYDGHGSHVAGIAVGNMVANANVYGEGSGTASGVAPHAHLAVYQVCTPRNCDDSTCLAGFEAAIADGVDIISISMGTVESGSAPPIDKDGIAIGAFSAVRRGIFVSAAAGNLGPSGSTVKNEAPWILTVGTSTTDREIKLGIRSVLDLQGSTSYGNLHAPAVADFSSRGPCRRAHGIIKPDIIGPGVQIIAPSNRGEGFSIESGTSMACPHLSGAAALIKASHPKWSPAAIRSALMTTAYQTNFLDRPIEDAGSSDVASYFDMGAGHVDVTLAGDPGLVFDIQPDDYIAYLCFLGDYSSKQVSAIVSSPVDCGRFKETSQVLLNYPSLMIDLGEAQSATVPRTFTNVGSRADELYKVEFHYAEPDYIHISVDPPELRFSDLYIKRTFQVTATRKVTQRYHGVTVASMVWYSDKHSIWSPIMVYI